MRSDGLAAAVFLAAQTFAAAADLAIAADSAAVSKGVKVMPKLGVVAKVGNVRVDEKMFGLPWTVQAVSGEWLWVGDRHKGWVKQSQIVRLDRAAAYYTQCIERQDNAAWASYLRDCTWLGKDEFDRTIADHTEADRDDQMNELEIKIKDISASGVVTIEMCNSSRSPIRLWEDSNSWGASRWRVMRIRKGELDTFYQNTDQGFTKNNPRFSELSGGACVERKLALNEGNWCGFGHCSSRKEHGIGGREVQFDPYDVIIVSYDVPLTPEATRLQVCHGVVAALMTVHQ